MSPILVASCFLLSLFLFFALVEWAEVFVMWKRKKQDQYFQDMVAKYKKTAENKEELSVEQQHWIEDIKRLLSLNAIGDEKVSALSELNIITDEEIEQSKETQPPAYSFKRATFGIAFIPLLTIAIATALTLSSISIIGTIYAVISTITIVAMLFLGIVDQKSHMIPLEIAIPAFVMALCYVIVIVLSNISSVLWLFIGCAISILVFAIPYIWLLKTKNTISFGKGDILTIPSYAVIISPLPIAGLIGTIIPMLAAAVYRYSRKTPDKRMPMGPFLAFGASFSIALLLLITAWF